MRISDVDAPGYEYLGRAEGDSEPVRLGNTNELGNNRVGKVGAVIWPVVKPER